MSKPYTYLIGWTKYDVWYYGVRFAKSANPEELWISYFTSSKHVAAFRQQHGEPDIIQIRKTFACSKRAKMWEHKILQRLNVRHNSRWLNQCDNLFPFNSSNKQYMKEPAYREAMSLAKRGSTPWNKGKSNPKAQGKCFYNNGTIQKTFYPNDVPVGWVKGRLNKPWNVGGKHTDETKRKIGLKSKRPRGPMSEEQKQKRRDAWARGCYDSLRGRECT